MMFLSWMDISGNWNYCKICHRMETGQEFTNFLYFPERVPGNFSCHLPLFPKFWTVFVWKYGNSFMHDTWHAQNSPASLVCKKFLKPLIPSCRLLGAYDLAKNFRKFRLKVKWNCNFPENPFGNSLFLQIFLCLKRHANEANGSIWTLSPLYVKPLITSITHTYRLPPEVISLAFADIFQFPVSRQPKIITENWL